MTTIAYDGRYIAADGMRSDNRIVVELNCNKFREFKGFIAALCGDYFAIDIFCNEFEPRGNTSINGEYCVSGIAFHEDYGVCRIGINKNGHYFLEKSPQIEADGSGMDFAISAMDFGKEAVDAVKYAATRCKNTGGTIRCFDTHTGKFIKVKQ